MTRLVAAAVLLLEFTSTAPAAGVTTTWLAIEEMELIGPSVAVTVNVATPPLRRSTVVTKSPTPLLTAQLDPVVA
jgi:hypothetical protein